MIFSFALNIRILYNRTTEFFVACFWDFRDALRRKSLIFFRDILRIRKQKLKTL